jgi:hypothetical protein
MGVERDGEHTAIKAYPGVCWSPIDGSHRVFGKQGKNVCVGKKVYFRDKERGLYILLS